MQGGASPAPYAAVGSNSFYDKAGFGGIIREMKRLEGF
jgi:hypothetical protein